MFQTKLEDEVAQIDSGLGQSIDSFEDSEFKDVEESVGKLTINEDGKDDEKEKIVQILRQAFTPDEDHDTYLHILPARGMDDKAVQLIQMCPKSEYLDIQNNIGQTPLHITAYVDSYNVASELILNGAKMDYVDKNGRNIFHICAQRGHIKTLEAIIRAGFETRQISKMTILLNEKDFYGLSPFYLAVSNKHQDICRKLVDMKVDVNLVDSKSGNSPLHEAVIDPESNSEFIAFLIEKCGVEVDCQNYAGVTPLHCAAGKGDSSLLNVLLSYGADLNITDINDNKAIAYANSDILKIFANF